MATMPQKWLVSAALDQLRAEQVVRMSLGRGLPLGMVAAMVVGKTMNAIYLLFLTS